MLTNLDHFNTLSPSPSLMASLKLRKSRPSDNTSQALNTVPCCEGATLCCEVVLHAVVLRAVVLRAVVLRAAVLRAVVLRAAVLRAVVLRAVVLRAVVLRAAVLCAAVLRAVVLRAVVLRAVVLCAVVLCVVVLCVVVLSCGLYTVAIQVNIPRCSEESFFCGHHPPSTLHEEQQSLTESHS